MAISSTGGKEQFDQLLNEQLLQAACKRSRPLNEIIKDSTALEPDQSSVAKSMALNKGNLNALQSSPKKENAISIKSSHRGSIYSKKDDHALSVIGKQKDVKENAYSDKNVDIKYKSVDPITIKDSKEEDKTGNRINTIIKQLSLINDTIDMRAGKGKQDGLAKAKEADTQSQASAISFMYTSSSLNSRKKAKDGILQMNEESSARLKKSQLSKLQDQGDKKKKDVGFEKLSTKQSERSRFSTVSKQKSIKSKEGKSAEKKDPEDPEEIREDPEGEQEDTRDVEDDKSKDGSEKSEDQENEAEPGEEE